MSLYINPTSYYEFWAHGGSGLNWTFNDIVDQIFINYLSWGDSDGAGSNLGTGGVPWFVNSTSGYIGLQNLVVGGPVVIGGTLSIDVGTVTPALGIYAGAVGHNVSVVHIAFSDNFHLSEGPTTANVRLDGAASLNTANAMTLGDIYINGLNISVVDGSWVDIWAH
jgi:hypothetical protein